jgi:RHS repeat-associated protein
LLYQDNARTGKLLNYIYLGGSLIAIADQGLWGGAVTAKRYQHTDALGTPVAVTDENRAVIERSEYEPYGLLLNRAQHDGPGFTGHVQDALTSLTYMQQRYYDPMIGRFLSVDPVTAYAKPGINFNRYWYGNDNPYKFTDPDGRLPDWVNILMGRPVDSSGTRRQMSGQIANEVGREAHAVQSQANAVVAAAPKSVFIQVDAGAKGGTPAFNGNVQKSFGVLISPQGVDLYRCDATNVGVMGNSTSLSDGNSSPGFVMGGSAGWSLTGGISNANGMQQFSGTSTEANVSVAEASVTASAGNGTWTLSGSVGKGPAASVSVQPVETKPLFEKK